MNAFEDHESYSVESSEITDSSSSENEVEREEQDQHKPTLLPENVSNIMKSATPLNYKISAGAKKIMYECAMKLVEVIFEEAKEQCQKAGDDKLTGDHFVQAFSNVGLYDYYGYFSVFLQIHRENLNEIANPRTDGMVMVQQNNSNPDHPLPQPGIHSHLRLPIPAPFLVPPIPIQEQPVPLIHLGAPVPFPPYTHISPPVFHTNNPIPLLLPKPAQLLPLPMPLQQNAIAAASLPFHHHANNFPWALPLDQPHPLQHVVHAQTMSMQIQGGLAVHSVTVHHANHILREQHEQIHDLIMRRGDNEATSTSGTSPTDSCGPPDASP